MLRCLSNIEQENAPRFTTFVSPDNHSTIFHYRYPGFINNESKSLCNADDDFSHDFDIRQERSRPESTRRAPVSPAPSENAILPSAPVWLEETTCEESDLSLEADRKQLMDNIAQLVMAYVARHHEMPPMAELNEHIRGKIIIRPEALSSVVVNGDMRVILPDYNEMELRLTPLARTVYILFLMHPEGINLKDFGDHRHEIEQIYSLVMPARDDDAARQSIDELVWPGSDSLRQKLSLIRRAVRRQIVDPATAARYMVSGSRGTPFRIDLPANLIQLPAALIC